MDEGEFREWMWQRSNDLMDIAGAHTEGLRQIRDGVNQILQAVTKEVEEDSLTELLKAILAALDTNTTALERHNILLERLFARLPSEPA